MKIAKLFSIVLSATWPAVIALADTCTFTGNVSEYWDNILNWDCFIEDHVPTASDTVNLNDTYTVRVRAGESEECGELNIIASAVLLIETTDEEHGRLDIYGDVLLNRGRIQFGVPED